MPMPGGLPQRLSDAVEAYVNWRGDERPVSLRRLVKATSFMMPDLALTENELSELIARKLVSMGCNINFDMRDDGHALPDSENRPKRERRQAPVNHGTPRSAQ